MPFSLGNVQKILSQKSFWTKNFLSEIVAQIDEKISKFKKKSPFTKHASQSV